MKLLNFVSFHVQLDEACRRSGGKNQGIGGPLRLLSVWMWERFSVGRPDTGEMNPYIDDGHTSRLPTWAYMWDVVSEFTSDPVAAYRTYTNEFDNLTPDQVRTY